MRMSCMEAPLPRRLQYEAGWPIVKPTPPREIMEMVRMCRVGLENFSARTDLNHYRNWPRKASLGQYKAKNTIYPLLCYVIKGLRFWLIRQISQTPGWPWRWGNGRATKTTWGKGTSPAAGKTDISLLRSSSSTIYLFPDFSPICGSPYL